MARTDAHRPRWVWINDHPALRVEHHDHRNGTCELSVPLPQTQRAAAGACWVDLDWSVRTCSCPLCSGSFGRRAATRARRAATRTLVRAAAAAAQEEHLEELEGVVLSKTRRAW